MNEIIKKIYWILCTQFGLDLRRLFRSLRGIPRYITDAVSFRSKFDGVFSLKPCLYDWYEEGGTSNNEYFWQDLHIAHQIFLARPEKHVDVGSRLDGFVAHVASYRQIEVFDIRPVTPIIPGVVFTQADLMSQDGLKTNYCDSLSCLHALEHFGLGRYGDPIDVNGYVAGLRNMARLLKPGGIFYLSVPIGQPRVDFNANRVFDAQDLVMLAEGNGLLLQKFAWVEPGKTLMHSDQIHADLIDLHCKYYALGIFTFIKT